MKKFLPLALLLTVCLATTVSTQDRISLTDSTQLGVHVADGMVGDALIVSWNNERIHVFPGQYAIVQANQQYYFTLLLDPGACGDAVITFSAVGGSKKVAVDLPDCVVSNEPLPITQLPVENEFRTFKIQRLDAAEKYLQIDQGLRNQISQFQSLVESAKLVQDFNQRTAIADQALGLLNQLKNVVPYIVEKGHGTSAIGTKDLKPQLEARFTDVGDASSLLIYKEFSQGQSQAGGTTENPIIKDFSLFKIHLYNGGNNSTRIYLVEDQRADNWSEEPAYRGDVTIWELNLTAGEIRTISYEVNKIIDAPLTTRVYTAVDKPRAPQLPVVVEEPEPVVDQAPTDFVGQLIGMLGGIEKLLTGLLSLVIRK